MTAAADRPDRTRRPTSPSTSSSSGTPFREAHTIVGGLVRQAVERGVPLDELVVERSPPRSRLPAAARAGQRGAPAHDAGRRRPRTGRAPARTPRRDRLERAAGAGSSADDWRGRCRDRSTTATRSIVAPELLNKVLVRRRRCAARGAHRRGRGVPRRRRSRQPRVPAARRRATRRCSAGPGTLYVYFSLRQSTGA